VIGLERESGQVIKLKNSTSKRHSIAVNVNGHPAAKLSKEVNRKCTARNMTVQLSTPYTDPEWYNAQRYRQTDRQTDRETDDSIMPMCSSAIG